MGKGYLIVVDGLDGSGKTTKTRLVGKRLVEEGYKVKQIEFPTYTKSSALLEMYLSGEFGENPDDVNPYAASTFFAVDRFASYITDWKKEYEDGYVILTSRYTTSNAIHQSSKLPKEERLKFLRWLEDYEYNLIGIPRPDKVIFLNMPPEFGKLNVNKRYKNDASKLDIHEKDGKYQDDCYAVALETCDFLGWTKVDCIDNGRLKGKEENAEEIYQILKGIVNALC